MSSQTVLDFGPLALQVVQTLGYVVIAIAAYWLQGHVKDANSRNAILDAAENGVNFAINSTSNVAKGDALQVNIASGLTATAVRYVLQMVPDAVKRLGVDEKGLAKLVVSKIPNIQGAVSDSDLDFIASRVSGKPGTAPPPADLTALAGAVGPMIEQAVSKAFADKYNQALQPKAAAPPPPNATVVGP